MMRFSRKNKVAKRVKEYKVIVRWYHDEPLYVTTSNVGWWESNPEVRAIEIIG